FTRRDGQVDPVLPGGEGAGGVRRVGAGEVFGLVEVEDNGAVRVGEVSREGARPRVGGAATGGVAEDEPEVVAFAGGLEAVGLPVALEDDVSGALHALLLADDRVERQPARRGARLEPPPDAPGRVDGVPLQPGERRAERAAVVLDPQRV